MGGTDCPGWNEISVACRTGGGGIGMEPIYKLPFLSLYHADCMDFMKDKPDKYYDFAIVDPPYGLGFDGEVSSMTISPNMNEERKKRWRGRTANKYTKKDWDKEIPTKEYFEQLFRVSKNQIIWGGNHFVLPQSRGWIFWDKLMDKGFSLADGELAWTSFDKAVKKFTYLWAGFKKAKPENRIHPTQKPVDLYDWILKNYSEPNQKILDTHFGSGSIALAVEKANRLDGMNLHLTACEIDKDYIDASIKRISDYMKQGTLNLF